MNVAVILKKIAVVLAVLAFGLTVLQFNRDSSAMVFLVYLGLCVLIYALGETVDKLNDISEAQRENHFMLWCYLKEEDERRDMKK